jgi:hypothetical protein
MTTIHEAKSKCREEGLIQEASSFLWISHDSSA